jgi:hypothetical protein
VPQLVWELHLVPLRVLQLLLLLLVVSVVVLSLMERPLPLNAQVDLFGVSPNSPRKTWLPASLRHLLPGQPL